MSTEFNPMEGLLADLLSTWDEEPGEEVAAVAPSLPLVTLPNGGSLPVISALLTPVREPVFPEPVFPEPVFPEPGFPQAGFPEPRLPEPAVREAEPAEAPKFVVRAAAEPAAPVEIVPPPEELKPELVPEPVWLEDAGAAAACAATLARMEREFAQSEPVALPAQRRRMGGDAPRYVLFVVREMLFAVPIERVLETDRIAAITPLPGAAAGVRGLMNLRGEVVPVIDLREVLGWPAPENLTARRMLVIQDGNRQPLTALLVDQVKGLAAFAHPAWKSAEMAGAHGAEGYVNAVAERDQEWVGLLNLERVLDETHLPSLAAA